MQSKRHSLLEAAAQTFIGYWLNIGIQLIVYPFYGAMFSFQQNLEIGLIFLVVSLVRGYAIRRWFNLQLYKKESV